MANQVRKIASSIYTAIGKTYLLPILRKEWKRGIVKRNERPVEYAFAMKWVSKIYPTEILDVGPGKSSWPHLIAECGIHITAIDKIEGFWTGTFVNRHYYILNDDITKPKIKKQFDMITCISVLEHIPNHQAAMRGMFGLLRPGGYIILTVPYNEEQYVENIYKHPGAAYGGDFTFICQVFSRREIELWLDQNHGTIVEQEYYDSFTGDLWTFGKRRYPPRKVDKGEKTHLTCLLIQKTQ